MVETMLACMKMVFIATKDTVMCDAIVAMCRTCGVVHICLKEKRSDAPTVEILNDHQPPLI